MQKTIRLGLTNISITKPPFLEWKDGQWRLWTAYNTTLSSGTYTWLFSDGSMMRETIQEHIVTENAIVK